MHIRGDHAELVVGGRLDVRSAADARTALHTALDSGRGVTELVLEQKLLTRKQIDEVLDPERMIVPRSTSA